MKLVFTLISAIALSTSPCFSIDEKLQRPFSMGMYGFMDSGTAESVILDSTFVYETSGDTVGLRFSAPNAQTSAAFTAYAYCTGGAGTPNQVSADLYAGAQTGEDPQRPDAGASPLCSSSNVDASACTTTPSWLTFSFTGCTLAESQTYWVLFKNDEAAPATDSVNIQSRGQHEVDTNTQQNGFSAISSTSGITLDPTIVSGIASMVIKDSLGTIIGNPHVVSNTTASDSTWKGARMGFDTDMYIGGIYWFTPSADVDMKFLRIYYGSKLIKGITLDLNTKGTTVYASFPPILFKSGIDYDLVFGGTGGAFSAGTTYCIAADAPADVVAAGGRFTYVTGATPGSFTESNCLMNMGVLMANGYKKNNRGVVGAAQ